MEPTFFTLHDFMLHTKAVTYILMVVALVGFAFFWQFLSAKDGD